MSQITIRGHSLANSGIEYEVEFESGTRGAVLQPAGLYQVYLASYRGGTLTDARWTIGSGESLTLSPMELNEPTGTILFARSPDQAGVLQTWQW